MQAFIDQFAKLPDGYSTGCYNGARYGMTISRSEDGRRSSLYANELGGNDVISFNLYLPAGTAPRLCPCEMPADKVIDFVRGFMLENCGSESKATEKSE